MLPAPILHCDHPGSSISDPRASFSLSSPSALPVSVSEARGLGSEVDRRAPSLLCACSCISCCPVTQVSPVRCSPWSAPCPGPPKLINLEAPEAGTGSRLARVCSQSKLSGSTASSAEKLLLSSALSANHIIHIVECRGFLPSPQVLIPKPLLVGEPGGDKSNETNRC